MGEKIDISFYDIWTNQLHHSNGHTHAQKKNAEPNQLTRYLKVIEKVNEIILYYLNQTALQPNNFSKTPFKEKARPY